MEMSHSLRLKQSQKLVMTPQLQQVIKLLQLPTLDLVDLVRQELETNPLLEETIEESPVETKTEKPADPASEEGMDSWLALAAEAGPPEYRDRDREEERESAQEGRMIAAQTLEDFLLAQLALLELDPEDAKLALFLVGNLDDNGWLAAPLAELAASEAVTPERLERALRLVQSLDPPGVGARDLKECLLLQLPETGGAAPLARRVVGGHLEQLERFASDGGNPALAKELGVTAEELAEAVKLIRSCDPKPGRQFADLPPAVFPDARVEKIGDDYVVSLNDNGVPPLRLSASYREMLANRAALGEEERRYLQERFRAALMLVRGIEQRRVTLFRTLDHIVKLQRDFLDRGAGALKALTLREVADAIGVHESTVSRVVANKYVNTPRGVFALRDFFSNRLPSSSANGTSAAAVRERIRGLIEDESAADPLSDEALAERMRREGVAIARRTITKYREALHLPPAWQRKHHVGTNGRVA